MYVAACMITQGVLDLIIACEVRVLMSLCYCMLVKEFSLVVCCFYELEEHMNAVYSMTDDRKRAKVVCRK
jgi:hypothetical protein